VIDDILEPKYSTDSVRINVKKVTDNIEHYIIKFVKSTDYPDWFYMSGEVIRKHPIYPNGSGRVYEVPMSKREEFEQIKPCQHTD
jgi:hypothetical protein